MTSQAVIIGGVPGVGKTTVINRTIEMLVKKDIMINLQIFGSVMLDIAAEKFNVKDRDELRKLDPEMQKDIQRTAAIRINERAIGNITIVDTHFAIKTGDGSFLQGIPKWVSDAIDPKILVLIETNPYEIAKRRKKDKKRKRDKESTERLKIHQEINRTIATTICQKTGALLAIIVNQNGKVDEAAKELTKILEKLV